jgi:hypothetical protein
MRRKTFLVPLLMTGMILLLAFAPEKKTKITTTEKPDSLADGESVPLTSFVNRSTFERRTLLPFERWARIKKSKENLKNCSTPNLTATGKSVPAHWLYYWDFFGASLIDEYNPDFYIIPWCQDPPFPTTCNDYPYNACSFYWTGKLICKIKAEPACGTGDPECYRPNLGTTIVTWYRQF